MPPWEAPTDRSQLGGDHVFGPVGCGLGCASDNQMASTPELPRKARPVVIRGRQLRHLKSTMQAFTGGPWRPSQGQARGQGWEEWSFMLPSLPAQWWWAAGRHSPWWGQLLFSKVWE